MALLPKIVHRDQRGFTLIDLMFVLSIIGLVSTLAMPALARARGSAQASSAVAILRMLNGAQLSFAIGCGNGFYAPDLPSLGLMPPASTEGFIPADLGSAPSVIRGGYVISIKATSLASAPPTCNGLTVGKGAPGYAVVADPLDVAGFPRFFATNADGMIYEHSSSLEGVMPETGPPAAGTPINQ